MVDCRTFSGSSNAAALSQFSTRDFHSLAFDSSNADTIYFGHHGGLMVRTNAGKSWEDGTIEDADAMQLGFPVADMSQRYAAGHNVFLVSTDGGETWQQPPNNLPSLDLHSSAASPSDALRVCAAPAGSGVFTSADGGATWQPISTPPMGADSVGMMTMSVAPDDPLHISAGGSGGSAESRDGGQTWQTQPGTEGTLVALAAAAT